MTMPLTGVGRFSVDIGIFPFVDDCFLAWRPLLGNVLACPSGKALFIHTAQDLAGGGFDAVAGGFAAACLDPGGQGGGVLVGCGILLGGFFRGFGFFCQLLCLLLIHFLLEDLNDGIFDTFGFFPK